MITGIIPAAGIGQRWGMIHKELLPTGTNTWLIDNCIESMSIAEIDRVCIISSPEKICTHVQHFLKDKYDKINIFYTIQKEKTDIWGAIKSALPFTSEINYFGMPDTIFNTDIFLSLKNYYEKNKSQFIVGTFLTDNPENFGVWHNNRIVNKQKLSPNLYHAWGIFMFTNKVVELWNKNSLKTYTDAINLAIEKFGFTEIGLEFYHDFKDWNEYKKLLRRK